MTDGRQLLEAHLNGEALSADQRDALRITAEKNLLRAETNNLYRTETVFAGQILQAARGWGQGVRLLRNWWPQAGEQDRRGWEWYYLAGVAWPDNHIKLRGHTDSVQHGAFSPDGKWFYSFGAEEVYPMADQFYGDRAGRVRDPFGHHWIIATRVREVPEEEMAEAFKAMFGA